MSTILEGLAGLKMEMHQVKMEMPSVVVGNIVTPSNASRDSTTMATVLSALSLNVLPTPKGLPTMYVSSKWKFAFEWGDTAIKDTDSKDSDTKDTDANDTNIKPIDKVLEKTAYPHVLQHLEEWGFHAADVSDGAKLTSNGKFLFNQDIYTLRQKDPRKNRGQRVYRRHCVRGRSDIAVLNKPAPETILRHMVDFVIEVKTVAGLRQSRTGCLHEAQVQLIGLNAANHERSPPVVMTDLKTRFTVLHLALESNEPLKYVVYQQECNSFPQAVHLAKQLAKRDCQTQDFSRSRSDDGGYGSD
jgi:hypothetical protein